MLCENGLLFRENSSLFISHLDIDEAYELLIEDESIFMLYTNNDVAGVIEISYVNNEIISYVHSDKNMNHRNHTIEHKATGNLQNSKKIDTRVKVLGKKKGKIEFVIVDDFNKELLLSKLTSGDPEPLKKGSILIP